MTPDTNHQIHEEEIAHLAYLSWQKDGCPTGRDVDYWLEAESHLKATKHLYMQESGKASQTNGKPKVQKLKTRETRKAPVRRELVPQP